MVTGLYAAIAALMLVFVSARVIGQRRSQKVSVGTGGNPGVERAMRVQGNFTEYVPLTLILLGLAELNGLQGIWVHALGATMIFARMLHFIGFSSENGPMLGRVVGMLITFGVLVVLSGVVGFQFYTAQ